MIYKESGQLVKSYLPQAFFVSGRKVRGATQYLAQFAQQTKLYQKYKAVFEKEEY